MYFYTIFFSSHHFHDIIKSKTVTKNLSLSSSSGSVSVFQILDVSHRSWTHGGGCHSFGTTDPLEETVKGPEHHFRPAKNGHLNPFRSRGGTLGTTRACGRRAVRGQFTVSCIRQRQVYIRHGLRDEIHSHLQHAGRHECNPFLD